MKVLIIENKLTELQGTKCMFSIMNNMVNQHDIPQWNSLYDADNADKKREFWMQMRGGLDRL